MSRVVRLVAAGLFAASYLASLFGPMSLPEGIDSDEAVAAALADSGDRTAVIVGVYLLAVAGAAFLVLLADLWRCTSRQAPRWSATMFAAGGVYVAMLFVAAAAWGAIPMGMAVNELPDELDPALYRVLVQFGFLALLVFGLVAAALMTLSFSMAGRGQLPTWLVLAGFTFAPLLLLGAVYLPQVLVPVWAVCAALGAPVERTRTAPA